MKKASILLLFVLTALCCRAQDDITGNWFGVLDVAGAKLRLVFHIQKTDGGYQATMDSPDQNTKGIPASSTTFKDSRLTISMSSIRAEYTGVLANGKIKGTFTQGQAFPLTLDRTEVKLERPQEPRPPYPYYSEDVRFENKQAGITLAGTLTLPQKEGNYPAVIFITGSGPQNRDEEIAGHKPFLVIADHLTRQGIAVLRFDDRGVGESTGNFGISNSADFAKDIEAAIDYLKTRKEIQPARIGLIGHSEGGMIAPMLASKRKDVSFIVLLAAPGVPCKDLWLKQVGDIANVKDPERHKAMMKAYEGIYNIMAANPADATKPFLESYLQAHMTEIVAGESMTPEQQKNLAAAMLATLSAPWFHYFLTFDPVPNLENTKCPVLALNGDKDIQVNAAENLASIEKSLTKAENRSFKIVQMKGLNHLFQECATGNPAEYGTITQTFSPEALNIISMWIKEQTGKKRVSGQ